MTGSIHVTGFFILHHLYKLLINQMSNVTLRVVYVYLQMDVGLI